MSNQSINNQNIHQDFKKIFYKNEGTELNGKKRFNFWILFAILTITFSAIGFAAGSLKYLKKKMDDPYINWFNVDLPSGSGAFGINTANNLNQDSIAKNEFKYQVAIPYYRFLQTFKTFPKLETLEVSGRSVDIEDPLLEELFTPKNLVRGRTFSDKEDLGIIVTREFLDKFGYDIDVSHVFMAGVDLDNKFYVPLPVIAVVKELPDLSYFAVTSHFAIQKRFHYTNNPFNRVNTKGLLYFIKGNQEEANKYKKKIEEYFSTKEFEDLGAYVTVTENNTSYVPGYSISVTFWDEFEQEEYDKLSEKMEIKLSDQDNLLRIYDVKTEVGFNENYDHLAVNFYDLEKVREFKDYILQKFNLSVDITQVEAKENYNYVSKLTLIISFILIFFSILNISMFISNVLSRHLEKIKMNIGTFKAFGLKRLDLVSIYIYLIVRFSFVSMILAFLVSLVFGESGGVRFILKILGSNIETGERYFDLFNWWSVLTILLIFAVTSIVTYFTSMKIVKQTPGDLIYNRT